MKKFKDLQRNLHEGSLYRVLSRFESGRTFAILTAYRNEYSASENKRRNRELKSILNKNGMGVQELIGYWQECTIDVPYSECPKDKLVETEERSFFITKQDDMEEDEFRKFIVDRLREYNQDGAVFGEKGNVEILEKDGSSFQIGSNISIGKMSQAYSRHIKNMDVPFVFE